MAEAPLGGMIPHTRGPLSAARHLHREVAPCAPSCARLDAARCPGQCGGHLLITLVALLWQALEELRSGLEHLTHRLHHVAHHLPLPSPEGLQGLPRLVRLTCPYLGIGNYVMVQAARQPSDLEDTLQGNGRDWTWGEVDAYQRSPINSGTQGD